MTYSAEERAEIVERVVAGLSKGTPLAVLCREDGMPSPSSWRDWCDADETLAIAYARAREDGFDSIAADCLAIADETGSDTKIGQNGDRIPDSEWISRSRLRIETRLKLLAKWDPKRYGELVKLAGSDGTSSVMSALAVTFVQAGQEASSVNS